MNRERFGGASESTVRAASRRETGQSSCQRDRHESGAQERLCPVLRVPPEELVAALSGEDDLHMPTRELREQEERNL